MFASKAGAYLSEAPLRCSNIELAPGLTHKHKAKLDKPARNKHFSLLSLNTVFA